MMKLMLMLFSMMIMIFLNINLFFLYNMIFFMTFLLLILNNYNNLWMNLYIMISNDYISFMLSLLSMYIVCLMLMIKNKKLNKNLYLNLIILLLLFLLLSFNSMNYFMFYLFFEMSLIPTFYLIMGWGYQPERINASLYMLFYTLFASLPLLIILFLLFKNLNTMNFYFLMNNDLKIMNLNKLLLYLYMILAFLVKLPMYLMHLWLPKAHVEAPVIGSMILAGVMLKLGGYGIMRSMMIMLNFCKLFNNMIMSLSLLGMFNLSLICLRQNDLKSLVAYSSVVHMMMMLIGMLSMMKFGIFGALLMMISHGLCSSALFYLVNLNYEKLKSRNLLINKGMMMIFPTLSMWWFMFCVLNMASPPSMNLISELLIFNIILNWSFNIIMFLMLIMLLSMMYSLYLFSYTQHGMYYLNFKNFKFINNMNFLNLLMHWIPLNLYFLNISFFL